MNSPKPHAEPTPFAPEPPPQKPKPSFPGILPPQMPQPDPLKLQRFEELEEKAHGLSAVSVPVSVAPCPVTVRIEEAPDAAVALHANGAAANRLRLHAVGLPGGGRFEWQVADPNVARFPNAPGDVDEVVLETVGAGTTVVTVRYSLGERHATATANVHVVELDLQGGAERRVALDVGAVNAPVRLVAPAHPVGGTYRWRIANQAVVAFQGAQPHHGSPMDFDALALGHTNVDVEYELHGVTLHDTTSLDVMQVRIRGAATRAMTEVEQELTLDAEVWMTPGGPTPQAQLAGTFAWTSSQANVADFANGAPGNTAQVKLQAGVGGTTIVEVAYTDRGVTTRARVTVEVVRVTIQEGAELVFACAEEGAAAAQFQLTAVGAPAGGNFAWESSDTNVVAHAATAAGNPSVATFDALAPRTCRAVASYTVNGVTSHIAIRLSGIRVTLNRANPIAFSERAPNFRVVSALIAKVEPEGHTLSWHIAHGNIAQFRNNVDPQAARTADLFGVARGSTTLEARYQRGNTTAIARRDVHVVGTSIVEQGPIVLLHPANGNATRTLHSVGAPAAVANANGVATWLGLGNNAPVRYAGNAQTVVNANATIETVAAGNQRVRVQYALANRDGSAEIEVRVRTCSCAQATWAPAGQANVQAQPVAPCQHSLQGERQRPHAAVQTVAPQYNHHHGTPCAYCAQNGQQVFHWIDPMGPAIQEVTDLRNRIHHARGLAAGARAVYVAANPWLANVPVDAFDPNDAQMKGKMFGVLLGTDGGGNAYKLRAISGSFPGGGGHPNAYWSRPLPDVGRMPTASRGTRVVQNPQGTYGMCAAAKLLAHALRLRLTVTSMAEIWIGRTKANRVDGQLQSSCDNCRLYLPYTLCDAGQNARVDAFANAQHVPAVVPNRGF